MISRRHLASLLAFVAALGFTAVAHADNPIQIENKKPVDPVKDSWLPKLDPTTYEAKDVAINGSAGAIDAYPSSWSIRNGDTLGLRVSTKAASFRTRIYRIGWYSNSPTGSVGSRLMYEVASTPGVDQPFPAENADTGLAEANWKDTLTVKIPNDWVTGQYVVRFTTDAGKESFTYFALRDDASATKAPILYVDTLATAFAYNPWPKVMTDPADPKTQKSGKSTYSYNSMGVDVKASGAKQAVAVSFDRPHGENWGLGIWRDWTVPTVQWLEQRGYDVAYANSLDQHQGYVLGSRKVWLDSGHDEYWSRGMYDNVEAALGKGLNLAWFSGNDLSWQVRFEPGSGGPLSTMVAYKIASYPDEGRCGTCWDWGGDPEFALALKAKQAGDKAGNIAHLRNVSYAWAGLKDWDPTAASPTFPGSRGAPVTPSTPIARVAIGFEGLMNGPKLPVCPTGAKIDNPCFGVSWLVDHSEHWIYSGAGVTGGAPTGLKDGDRIPLIVGYEMDNARLDATYASRPVTQVILAHTDAVFTPEKGSATDFSGKFNAQYFQHKSGAHVFAAGTINWFWGVERPDVGPWGGIALDSKVSNGDRLDKVITAMTINVLNKMLDGPGIPPTTYPDGGPVTPDDGGTVDDSGNVTLPDGNVVGPDGGAPINPGNPATPTAGTHGCGCQAAGVGGSAALGAIALAVLFALSQRRRKNRTRARRS